MSPIQIAVEVIVCVLLVWWLYAKMARAGSKPRTKPKVPRDRSRDTRVVFFFRLF